MSKTKKQAEPTFWLKDNRYFMLTGDDWQGCVFVALSGETPEKVCEHGMTQSHMEGAEQVEPWTVPLEWWRAFHAQWNQLPAVPPARPEPESQAEPHRQPVAQAEAEDEMLMHVAAGTDPFTSYWAAADRLKQKAYAPIKGPCPFSFMTGVVVTLLFLAIAGMVCS